MAKKKSNTGKLLIGGAAIAAIAYFATRGNKQAATATQPQPNLPQPAGTPAKTPATGKQQTVTTATGNTVTITTNKLNGNLLLSMGIGPGGRGDEVRELQKLLGVPVTGIFNNETKAALLKRKGVESISLNQFNNTP